MRDPPPPWPGWIAHAWSGSGDGEVAQHGLELLVALLADLPGPAALDPPDPGVDPAHRRVAERCPHHQADPPVGRVRAHCEVAAALEAGDELADRLLRHRQRYGEVADADALARHEGQQPEVRLPET